MLKHILTRYTFRYLRSLAYMLQSSEYNPKEYLAWYHATKNFSSVEQRGRFVKTPKGIVILSLFWIMSFVFLFGSLYFALRNDSAIFKYFCATIILATPFLLPYVILGPLFIIKWIVEVPTEKILLRRARCFLELHRGMKIAIAGSYGKTTMRETLKTVLSQEKKVAAPPHNHNTPLGIIRFLKTLKGDENVLIFELGEYYPGDIKKLCEIIHPDMGIITGINEAHLKRFKTLEQTRATIFELSDFLKEKPLYINGENTLARKGADAKSVLYSRNQVGKYSIENQKTSLAGTSFTLKRETSDIEFHSPLLGLHQIGHLAVAIDISLKLSMPEHQIKKGIERTKAFHHRFEPIFHQDGTITIDDSYNGNPDGVHAIIEFLTSIHDHRIWYVTPGLVEMGIKTEAIHLEIGKLLAKSGIEKVVLIKNSVTPFIEKGLLLENFRGKIVWFERAEDALSTIHHMTISGDIIVLQNDWPDQYR